MADGKKKITREERIKINQERAQEPFAQVIMRPEHVDGRVLYDIAGALSKGIKVLRNVMGHKVTFNDAEKLLTRTKNIEMEANELARDIFSAIGFEYREPRSLQTTTAVGDVVGAASENPADDGKEGKRASKKA